MVMQVLYYNVILRFQVVLVGMGADEQLVGYTRHRGKFSAEGWPGLMGEIQMEIERISARNLGRDDRVISDHGRESRFPFLDERVVAFLNATPLWLKVRDREAQRDGEEREMREREMER
jgi:asparagine synthetase B (glutamine-hydrolysing)